MLGEIHVLTTARYEELVLQMYPGHLLDRGSGEVPRKKSHGCQEMTKGLSCEGLEAVGELGFILDNLAPTNR